MKTRFNIYEIEHQGDENNALLELAEAGCTSIMVVSRDYEAETIRVECDLPHNISKPAELKLNDVCL